MTALYHFWSDPPSQRIRMALHYKGIPYEDYALDYDDDETFFELGIARRVPVLVLDDASLHTDSLSILWQIDKLFPSSKPLVQDKIDAPAWQALIAWREKSDAIFERLYAPVRAAYRGIGDDETRLQAYKHELHRHYGMSLEELANDRYDGYVQLDKTTQLTALSRHLAKQRFYTGQISIADLVLCADIYPVQVLDGVSLPIDLMYFTQRVAQVCGISLEEGLIRN